VLAQCVVDLNTILSPFLPHAANAVDRVYGGTGDLQPMPQIVDVSDLDDGSRTYPVITGDYSGVRAWRRTPVAVDASVTKPTPVFTKLAPRSSTRNSRAWHDAEWDGVGLVPTVACPTGRACGLHRGARSSIQTYRRHPCAGHLAD
jgi:hypothetical protein